MDLNSVQHIFNFVKSTDNQFDAAHGSNHCIDVLHLIFKFIHTIGPIQGLSENRVRLVLTAATLFHEQKDRKKDIPCDEKALIEAMLEDGLTEEEIEIVLWLISYCSFSKSKEQGRFDPKMLPYNKLMDLLSSADLAEAVNEKALYRSYEYGRKMLTSKFGRDPTEKEMWQHVYSFYNNKDNGFFVRLNAISVPEIKESLNGTLEETDKKMMEMVKKYNLFGNN